MDNPEKYYKKSYRKNKKPFGSILDKILGLFLIFVISGLILREIGLVRPITGILSFCLTMIICVLYKLISTVRFTRFVQSERKRIAQSACVRAALFMSEVDFSALIDPPDSPCDSFTAVFQSLGDINADQILTAYRNAKMDRCTMLRIVSLSPLTEEAQSCMELINDMKTEIIDRETILSRLAEKLCLTDDVIDERFMAEYKERHTKVSIFQKLRQSKKRSPYIACGVVLLLLSFFLKFSLYYKLLASLCFWIGLLKGASG